MPLVSPHLDFDKIARMYAFNEGQPEELAQFLLHLEESCPECDQTLRRLHEAGKVARDASWWQVLLAMSRDEAEGLWQGVRGLRGEMLAARLKGERFATWGFLECLCEASRRQTVQDPRRGLELAEQAVAIAYRLPEDQLDPDCHREARALAHAILGNAHRVTEARSLARAEHAKAEEIRRTIREPYLGYTLRILMLRTSLEWSEKNFDAAQTVLDEAFELVDEAEGVPPEAETLAALWIQRSLAQDQKENIDAAIQATRQALAILEAEGIRSRMLFCAKYRLLELLLLSGRHQEVAERFPDLESLIDEVAGATDRLKLAWFRARLCHSQHSSAECLAHLRAAQEGFLEMGLCHHAVVVTLEICKRLLDQGEIAEVQRQATRLLALLLGQATAVEALAPVAMLKRAAETGQLNRELLDQLQAVLEPQARARRRQIAGGADESL